MRRTLTGSLLLMLLITPIVRAQVSDQATLRTAAVTESITTVQQNGIVYLPIDRIVSALGGQFNRSERGFAITLDDQRATFGSGDLEAVVGENLISLGERPPIVIENRPFVPIQFVREFLRPADLEPAWDPASKTLTIQPLRREIVNVEATLTSVGPLTKIILEMSRPANFSIVRKSGSYVVQFRSPIRTSETEINVDDALVSRLAFGDSSLEVFLRTPQIAADSYRLESPPRIVLDLTRSSAVPQQTTPQPPRRSTTDSPGINTIVIDPGHGGKEVGAQGPSGALEKELTLQIARKLRDQLASRGFRVILTRDEDILVDLDQRPAVANQYKADLFLSIHLNAVPFRSAYGAETYFLSLEATDDRARLSAERENANAVQPATPSGSDLDLILWDLAQQRYLKESSRFAELIQDEMATTTGVERRGVKQAPFRVLLGATMPAALVEVGFISNPDEESKLSTAEYQTRIAAALTEAVTRYKGEYEKRAGNGPSEGSEQTASAASLHSGTTRSEP